jgi:hypothetical protein
VYSGCASALTIAAIACGGGDGSILIAFDQARRNARLH